MSRKPTIKVCAHCGKEFPAKAGGQLYCSITCHIDKKLVRGMGGGDDCWVWSAGVQIRWEGVQYNIIHLLWEQAGGMPIPKTGRAWLEKTCTGEGCVNPAHRKRVQQRVVRDCTMGGAGFGRCTLTVREIKEIRMNRWDTVYDLAKRYNTTQYTIKGIREGKLYQEVVITGEDWK